jgi:hypothetical protein
MNVTLNIVHCLEYDWNTGPISRRCKGAEDPTELGTLEGASLDHWTVKEVETAHVFF